MSGYVNGGGVSVGAPTEIIDGYAPVDPASKMKLGIIQLDGDLSGTAQSPMVTRLQGKLLPSGGVAGQFLSLQDTDNYTYSKINLNDSNHVAGIVNASNLPSATSNGAGIIKLTSDLSGTWDAPVVNKIKGTVFPGTEMAIDGNVLNWSGNALVYSAINLANTNAITGILGSSNLPGATAAGAGIVKLSGDLGGTSSSPTVLKINGASVPNAMGITVGQVLKSSGMGTLTYGAVDLSNGDSVSGILDGIHLPDASGVAKGIIQLAGDLSGTSANPTISSLTGTAGVITNNARFNPSSLVNNAAVVSKGEFLKINKTINLQAGLGITDTNVWTTPNRFCITSCLIRFTAPVTMVALSVSNISLGTTAGAGNLLSNYLLLGSEIVSSLPIGSLATQLGTLLAAANKYQTNLMTPTTISFRQNTTTNSVTAGAIEVILTGYQF